MDTLVIGMGLAVVVTLLGFGLNRLVILPLWQRAQVEPEETASETPAPAGRQRLVSVILLVTVLAFFGLSAAAFGVAFDALNDEDEISNWPSAQGEIVYFESFENVRDTDMSMVGDVVDSAYSVVLRYEYEVDGETYVGERISVDETVTDENRLVEKERAEELSEKYSVGTEVEVYYNPDDPARAGLERPSGEPVFALSGAAGILFALVAGGFFLPFLLSRRQLEAAPAE